MRRETTNVIAPPKESFGQQSTTPSQGEETPHRLYTISNLLSVSRAVLAIPFALVMLSDSPNATLWGIVILALAALTDKFDGVLARKLNEVTEWGKILDPVCDKIGMAVVAMTLVMVKLIPLWFVAAMVVRDLLILAGGIYVRKKKGIVLQSNQLGKWTIGVIALAMFFAMIHWSVAADVFLWGSVVMLAGSFVQYVMRFMDTMHGETS